MKVTTILMFLIFLVNGAIASEVNEYIEEGVKLHDQGSYDKAAEKYKKALELEPNNSQVLFELTITYMVSKQNEKCIETAKQGVKIESKFQKKLFGTLASCHSQLGRIDDALKAFNSGLVIDPKDSELHLNIAVTYSNSKQDEKAIFHLKEAIKNSNGYSSPYYFLAEIYRTKNYKIPALFLYMQFVLLEPNTRRSEDASQKIYYLLYQGVDQKDKELDVVLDSNAPKDEGDFTTLELALSLAAARSIGEESTGLKTDAERHNDALDSFIKISGELDDEKLEETFTWQFAAKNMVNLANSDHFKTFSYILAERAGIQGAGIWLDNNQNKIETMANAIKAMNLR